MALIRWRDPFSLLPRPFWNWPSLLEEDSWPVTAESHLDVYEEEDDVVVKAAIPGVNPDEVDVSFEDGRLWIKAEALRNEKDKHYFVKGRVSYNYNVVVPNVDPDKEPFEASTDNGVLEVRFKKAKKKEAKKVKVKVTKK
jgi:HSP20 family protein